MQPDNEIWDLVLQGDTNAFGVLFDRYWEEMFAKAFRRLGDEALAKDVVQRIFIHCWEHRTEIDVTNSLAPYLMTALKYSIVRQVYQLARKRKTDLPLSAFDIPDTEADYQEEWQQMDALQQAISHEVSLMPPRMQEIFRLNREQQLSIKAIALRLSISEQTVKNTLHFALKRLRTSLRDQAFLLPFIL